MKKILKITLGILLFLLIGLYFGIVCVLPQIINSKITTNKIQLLILDKTGIKTNITGLNLKISPKLTVALNIKGIEAKNNNVSVVDIKNILLQYEILQKRLTFIGADNIYVDGNTLKQFKKPKQKKKKTNFELNNIPKVHIKNLTFASDNLNIQGENIDINNNLIKLNVIINSPLLKEQLKLGELGSLQIVENKLKANNFKIALGGSNLYLDGILIDKNKNLNFDIKGEKLPVSEIMPIVLHLQKTLDSSKKFLENFKNFEGTVDVNLKVNKNGIWGTCLANNLKANAVWFDIPLSFKEAVFNFKGTTIESVAEGILGNEKVIHTLDVVDLLTPKKEVIGTVKTTLTKKFNFVPN